MANEYRRFVIVAVSLTIVFTMLLSGCSPQVVKETVVVEKAVEKVVKETVVVEATPEPIEINVWHRWSGTNGELLDQLARDFEAKNPGVKVNMVTQVGEYLDLLQKMIADVAAGKQPPEIFIGGYNLLNYIAEELGPVELDKLEGFDVQSVFDRYEPQILALGNVAGKQIGLPFSISNIIMYYNPEIFEEAGLDPDSQPETWADVFEQGRIVKEKTGKYPIAIQKMDNWSDQALIFSAGGELLSDDMMCVAFDNPSAVQAYEMWADLHEEGLSPVATDEEIHASFAAGGIGAYCTTIMKLRSLREQCQFELGVAPFPSFEGKTKALPAGGAAIMIFTRDPEKLDAAWKLADFLVTEEAMQTWTQTGYLCVIDAEVPVADGQEIAYSQVPNARPWLSWPGGSRGLEVDRIFMDARTKIIYGEMDAQEGLQRAAEECNTLLDCK